MKRTLSEIAVMIDGETDGPGDLLIEGVTGVAQAGMTDITFAEGSYLEKAAKSSAAAVIVAADVISFPKPVIRVVNPRLAFVRLLRLFTPPLPVQRVVHELAVVAKTAQLGKNVAVMPLAVVDEGACIGDNTVVYSHVFVGKDVKVGCDCILYPNVTVRENCFIGDRVIIQSGAVVGGDGFGFVTVDGAHLKVPQIGNVVIEDDVEIGANTAIDRATTGQTVIMQGTKIDNLVHIAHNDVIGKHCFVVAQTGISGSVTVGDNVTFAGQTGTAGHISIGDNCVFIGRAGITKDIPANSFCAGVPARPHQEWLRETVALHKLPETLKKIKDLEKRLAALEGK